MYLAKAFVSAAVLASHAVARASRSCSTSAFAIAALFVEPIDASGETDTRIAPTTLRATAFGFFSSAALFGGALSPSVAGLLVRWDLTAIYGVDAAIFALLAAGLWLASPRAAARGAEPVGGA